jgi:hypothetical protein
MKRFHLAVMAVLGLGGCAAEIRVSEISNELPPGSAVEGIPFRTPKRFTAVIYEKQKGGYVEMTRQLITVPDPDRLFLLGFRGQPLSNSTIDLALNPDNTIQQISLKSTSTGAAALTAAGAQLNAVATAEAARQKAGTTATTASSNLAIAADKAKQAADLAALQREVLLANPAASATELLAATQKVRSAKLDANEAARLAGKPPYFPDVFP